MLTKSLPKILGFIATVSLVTALGIVSSPRAQAVVTAPGTFTGYSAADVKAYVRNTAPITMTMTTQTALTTDSNTFIELVAGGGGEPWSVYGANGAGCAIPTCPDGDIRLAGFTFSIVDSSSAVISIADASYGFFSDAVRVSFSGTNPVTIPAGSTVTFAFSAGKLSGGSRTTNYIRSRHATNGVIDQTATMVWFKRLVFDGNGTSASNVGWWGEDIVLASDPSATTPLPSTFYRAGYTFTGWNSLANGTGTAYAPGASFNYPAMTNTLYAQWTANSATVTFNANDGSGSPATRTQTASTSTALTANTFTRAGYTFAGWTTLANGTGTSYANSANYPFSASTTLFAKWTANTNAVTYDSQGGSAVNPGSFVTGGTIAALPSAPTRDGYTFTGWYPTSTGGSAIANGYAPTATASITVYSQWSANSNVITYDSQGGSAVSPGSFVTGGSIATLPSAPTRPGYTFLGWFRAASGGAALANGHSPTETSSITLHAQWRANTRTVTFNANGGSGTMPAQNSGSGANLSAVSFARSGFGFTGWNTAANGSGTAYAAGSSYPFSSDETLYAQWRELPPVPIAEVDIQVPVGSSIADAPVALDIDGLKDETGYVVTVFSTPQIIDQGTIWSGRLNTTVRIPANLEAGWHRLVIEGTAADGTPWTETNYFKVSPGGLLLATSEVVPAELAYTGAKQTTGGILGGTLFALGVLLVGTRLVSRRRHKA